jgi:Ca2+-binding RTX toxin-like protein
MSTNPAIRWDLPTLKADYTVIDLNKAGTKTTWNFAADEDVLFIASDQARTLDRLQTTGGNNIVLIGGEFVPKSSTSAAGTLNFTKVNGSVYVEGVHINHRYVGEKDAINFYSAAGKDADFTLQNSLIENVKGSYAGIHGDIFQPQGPVGDLKFYNVTGTTTYQGLFLQPKNPIKSVTLENVEIKKIPGGDAKSWLYYFSQPGDQKYPVSLKNVYVTEQSGQDAEYSSVYPSAWLDGAVRNGDTITFPKLPYAGSMKIGTAGFMTADEVGLHYDLSGFSPENIAATGAFRGTANADSFIGSAGKRTVDYGWAQSAVDLDLSEGKASGGSGNDRMSGIDNAIGSSHADHLTGNGNANVLAGGAGNDVLKGGAGADQLNGSTGNDILDGGTGADKMLGGVGNDTYVVDNKSDRVEEYSGDGMDTVVSSISWTLNANVENLTFTSSSALTGWGNDVANVMRGGAGSDTLHGMRGNDSLLGGGGNDNLYSGDGADYMDGGAGKDILKGAAGNDVLKGGGGMDRLYGEAGSDSFVFDAVSDSLPGWGKRDSILDFDRGYDRIDLTGIDAKSAVAGNQAFSFIGESSFDHVAGQLRWSHGKGFLLVQGDVNGDGKADFEIQITGTSMLDKSAFLL